MSTVALVAAWTGALVLACTIVAYLLVRGGRGRRARELRGAEPPEPDPVAGRAERLRNLLLVRMSHDLRSPLNSVVTLSQLLAEGDAGPLSVEQRRYVDVIRHAAQTLLALINDILDLAAVEAGRVELEVGPVDVAELAQGVADATAPAAHEKGVPVHVSAPDTPLLAQADEEHLRQIIQRLVEHAISETRNGYVEIAAVDRPERRAATLRVHETVESLSEENRRALAAADADLDSYLIAADTVALHAPPALPLVVAARMARLMGLAIRVEANDADGVTFEIELPRTVDAAAAVAPPAPAMATPAAQASRPVAAAAAARVLVIEDDVFERQRTGTMLEGAGYAVTLAGSGDEGLSLLRAGRFDVVVLDLVMPGVSGPDVLRAARAEARLAHLPFVVLSALYMTKDETAVLGPNVASVVRKGATTEDALAQSLRRAVRNALAEPRAVSGNGGGTHA